MKNAGYVYAFYNEKGKAIYIGQTTDVIQRFNSHKYENIWIDEVEKIIVHGPYDTTNIINYYEECYIRAQHPKYNLNYNSDYECISFDDPFNVVAFDNEDELIEYFIDKKESLKRCSFYLRNDQVEAIRDYAHEHRLQKSELIRRIIDDALL